MVIADVVAPPHVPVKVFSHTLGESSIAFFAPTDVATRIRRRFPSSLDGAPMVLPPSNTMLRRTLDQWFDARAIHPRIIGEFEDPALMKAVGADAGAIVPAPAAIERRIRHPGVAALTSVAREDVFAAD